MFPLPFVDFPGAILGALLFGSLVYLQARHRLRVQHFGAATRILRNLVLAAPALVIMRLVLVPIPYFAAIWAQKHGIGLWNWLPAPFWLAAVGAFLMLDYGYYWWHVGTHRIPLLWRFHNVHHTDLDMDVSTAARFHFVEIGISVVYRVALVLLIGAAPLVYLFYEMVFELETQFHHSNWRLPYRLERLLNLVIVTPRMHGIHHSIVKEETNSNWSSVFCWWDKIHGSYRMDVAQDEITIGVPAYRDERELTLGELLKMPFEPIREWKLPGGAVPSRAPSGRQIEAED